jgi:hypothetical protein
MVTEPYKTASRAAVYLAHQTNLLLFLTSVMLVNAYGIDPDDHRFFWSSNVP